MLFYRIMDFDRRTKIMVTCQRKLGEILAEEVLALGFQPKSVFPTGVELEGSLRDCIRLNLHLRTASQVLYSLFDFEADHIDEIYEVLLQLPWEAVLESGKRLSVTSNVFHESINNSMYANLRVKDAIVDRMRDKTGVRPDTSSELDEVVIHLFWKENQASVYVDTSGASLARHGYRKIPGTAPMLESLAAAVILASRWDAQSAFVNPMCGSGTLAIEAALIASRTPPSVFRMNYAFMHLKGYDADWYDDEMDRINEQIIETPTVKIIASDISTEAVDNTIKNAKAAGLLDWIECMRCSYEETPLTVENKGVVFFNPEYGERLGDESALEEVYKGMGDFMKQRAAGYWGYIFTGNMDLAKCIGLKPKRKMDFYNSKIACKLLEYELYEGKKVWQHRHGPVD